MLAIAERMPETSESIPLIGQSTNKKEKWKVGKKTNLKQTNKHGHLKLENCGLSIGLWMRKLFCSWCTKVSSGPLLHIQSWKIAAQQKNSFQKCTNFTGSHCSLKTNILSGIYLTFVMAMTTVSVIMTVMVLNFFYRGPVLTEVPPWVRKWVGYQTIRQARSWVL